MLKSLDKNKWFLISEVNDSLNCPFISIKVSKLDELLITEVTIPPPDNNRCSLCILCLWFTFEWILSSSIKDDSADIALVVRKHLPFFIVEFDLISSSLVDSLLPGTTTAEFGPLIDIWRGGTRGSAISCWLVTSWEQELEFGFCCSACFNWRGGWLLLTGIIFELVSLAEKSSFVVTGCSSDLTSDFRCNKIVWFVFLESVVFKCIPSDVVSPLLPSLDDWDTSVVDLPRPESVSEDDWWFSLPVLLLSDKLRSEMAPLLSELTSGSEITVCGVILSSSSSSSLNKGSKWPVKGLIKCFVFPVLCASNEDAEDDEGTDPVWSQSIASVNVFVSVDWFRLDFSCGLFCAVAIGNWFAVTSNLFLKGPKISGFIFDSCGWDLLLLLYEFSSDWDCNGKWPARTTWGWPCASGWIEGNLKEFKFYQLLLICVIHNSNINY